LFLIQYIDGGLTMAVNFIIILNMLWWLLMEELQMVMKVNRGMLKFNVSQVF
jgi:hypothetical protein